MGGTSTLSSTKGTVESSVRGLTGNEEYQFGDLMKGGVKGVRNVSSEISGRSSGAVDSMSTAVADFAGEGELAAVVTLDANGNPLALAFDIVTKATGFDTPRYACPLLTSADLMLSDTAGVHIREESTRIVCGSPNPKK